MPKRGYTGNEMLSSEFKDPPALIKGLVWKNDSIIVLGDAKVGKSLWTMQMGCSLTSGEAFLDEFTILELCNVLFVQAEGKMSESAMRYKHMVNGIKSDPERLRWLYFPRIPMDRETSAEDFIAFLKKEFGDWKPAVIVFDPLYKLISRGSLTNDDIASMITGNLDIIKEYYDATIIINHHEHRPKFDQRKGIFLQEGGGGSIFGSYVWRAWPDHVLHFKMLEKLTRQLTCDTQRSGAVVEDLKLFFNEPDPLFFEIQEDTSQSEHIIFKIMEKHKALHVSEISTHLPYEMSESTIYKALRKLIAKKLIYKEDERGLYAVR